MRIAIFVSNYSIGTSVAIINTCLFFAEGGVKVDIFSYKNVFEDRDVFKHQNICLHILSDSLTSEAHDNSGAHSVWIGNLMKILPAGITQAIRNHLGKRDVADESTSSVLPDSILAKSRNILDENSYTAFVGVGLEGLIWAEHLGGGDDIPLIYWSLELYLESDPRFRNHYYETVRRYAQIAHQKAIATIIQDEERAELLAREDHVSISKFIIVPVAMIGEPVTEKSNYLHSMLNIPKDKKIIIYVGLITKERLSLETAQSAANLPEDWVMALHGWCPDASYQKKIAVLQNEKFILSTKLLPFEQLVKMIASAHVGVSLYKASGDNERLTGAASSKTAQYLQCGLPLIVNDFDSMKKIVLKYKHGICVNSPSQIPGALDQINLQYDEMRRNAYKCYLEKYEITPHLKKVMNVFKNLESGLVGEMTSRDTLLQSDLKVQFKHEATQ